MLLVFFATAATAVFRLRDIKEGISVTEFLPQVRKAFTKWAQKLQQHQPLIAVFPRECTG